MKFSYQYRNRENEVLEGEIAAKSRDDAYSKLKVQGVRPFKVELKPGWRNRLGMLGKRGTAIVVLGLAAAGAMLMALSLRKEVKAITVQEEDRQQYEARSQIYGDQAVMNRAEGDGWREDLPGAGERFLAQYAVPGKTGEYVTAEEMEGMAIKLEECVKSNLTVGEGDLAEIAKMKRMVNWMKREARAYLRAGGTMDGYMERLRERTEEEARIRLRVQTELDGIRDEELWRERNASLRKMGLAMIAMPDELPDD